MHVYNTIIVLKQILPVFPVSYVNDFIGNSLSRAIEKFVDKEERGDLKILGRAYVRTHLHVLITLADSRHAVTLRV